MGRVEEEESEKVNKRGSKKKNKKTSILEKKGMKREGKGKRKILRSEL